MISKIETCFYIPKSSWVPLLHMKDPLITFLHQLGTAFLDLS